MLALDTALQRCSVAIADGDNVLAWRALDMERGHAEHLAPMTAAALDEAGLRVGDLARIGVVAGPGGFTGVRLAVSFARGLAIGHSIDVVGVTSLTAVAQNALQADQDALIAAVIDARRNQVYASLVHGRRVLVPPFVDNPAAAIARLEAAAGDSKAISVIGSGAEFITSLRPRWVRSTAGDQIDARCVAQLAAMAPVPTEPVAPIYLRAPDAKPPTGPNLIQSSSS
ncbi:MAG: tRNA (adenosine(37)-N6)-threonylcarbamoyltransferase complex dimerization subunit type 1 TsaB [Pseudomonadota bacterium]